MPPGRPFRALALALAAASAAAFAPSPAGDPGKALQIPGLGGAAYLAGSGVNVAGGSLTFQHNSGVSVVSACSGSWQPQDIAQFKLLGKSISFMVDLSKVGCACNLAFYLVSAPARDPQGNPIPGSNNLAPGNFYCDANKVGGQWCPEVDIMEANNHAFQATPHKCDRPTNGHYANCDRGGCAQNTRDLPKAYGPGAGNKIDTTKPFKVTTTFTAQGATLTGMITRLEQNGQSVTLDHSNCQASYLAELSKAMSDGMSLRMTYWGDAADTMSWMDSPPCGGETCNGANAGAGVISNIAITAHGGGGGAPPPAPGPAPVTVPLPPVPTTSLPYDCKAGLQDWRRIWSPAKKRWCCQHTGGSSCDPYDCFTGLGSWESMWTAAQKDWCCQHKFLGCPQSSQQQVGPLRWSNHASKCLTVPNGLDNTLIISTCEGSSGNVYQVFRRGNDGTIRWDAYPSICVAIPEGVPQNGTPVKLQRCGAVGFAQRFSIRGGDMKIRSGDSPNLCLDVTDHLTTDGTRLQLWKCISADYDQTFAWQSAPAAVPEVTTPALPPTTLPRTTEGFEWEPAGTTLGLPTQPPLGPLTQPPFGPPTEPPLGQLTEPPLTTRAATTTTELAKLADPFDCFMGDLEMAPWKQRVWCCSYKSKGCPVKIPPVWRYHPRVPFPTHLRRSPDLDAPRMDELLQPGDVFRIAKARIGPDGVLYLKLADDRGWVFENRPDVEGTLCEPYKVVVTTTTMQYDCSIDADRWQDSWSMDKKNWCCSFVGRGCPRFSEEDFAEGDRHSYDCGKDLLQWKTTWTLRKAAWCCRKENLGCIATTPPPFDCEIWMKGSEKHWRPDKRKWCCHHEHKGCSAASSPERTDFDCSKGWTQLWPKEKRKYCCKYLGIACPTRAFQAFSTAFEEKSGGGQRPLQPAGGSLRRGAVCLLASLPLLAAGLLALQRRGRRGHGARVASLFAAGGEEAHDQGERDACLLHVEESPPRSRSWLGSQARAAATPS